MKFQSLKRLIAEDFTKEQQDLISKIAFIYNPLVDQLNTMFNKNIDFLNLNQQLVTITTTVNTSGTPAGTLQFQSSLNSSVKGIQVISAVNNSDTTLPTGAPFITFTRSGNNIIVNNITGLPANKSFTLTMILYG